MSEENAEAAAPTEEVPGELTQEQKDDLFNEGIKEAMATLGGDTSTEELEKEKSPPTDDGTDAEELNSAKEAADAGKAPPEEAPVIAGPTGDELKAALAKIGQIDTLFSDMEGRLNTETRKLHGKFGEFQNKLKALTEKKGSVASADFEAKLAKLSEEWPEVAEVFKAASSTAAAPAEFDSTELREQLKADRDADRAEYTKKLADSDAATETKLMDRWQPGWREKVGTDDFGLWQATLTAAEKEQMKLTPDALYLAEKLDEFDVWKTEKDKPDKETTDERLANAIPPDSTQKSPAKTKTLEDLFNESMRKTEKGLGRR